jgi:AraC family transcriptional regulator
LLSQPDFARVQTSQFRAVHCLLPAWKDTELESVSAPGSIGIAFSAQRGAIIRKAGGPAISRDVARDTIGLGGTEPIAWITVPSASDVVEITGSDVLRRETAHEMGVSDHADLADIPNWPDSVIHAIGLRFRAALRGWTPFDELEAETLVRAAYTYVLRRKFDGRVGKAGALDDRRLARAIEFLRTSPGPDPSLAEVAAIVHLSPFHFARSFRAATGMPPHRFVTHLRMERALDELRRGATVASAAHHVGFSNLGHFRRLFRAHFGVRPSTIAA